MLAGKPHEAVSNGGPRWTVVGPRQRVHRTRPTGQLARRLTKRCAAFDGWPRLILQSFSVTPEDLKVLMDVNLSTALWLSQGVEPYIGRGSSLRQKSAGRCMKD
jgi:hypothetical protein